MAAVGRIDAFHDVHHDKEHEGEWIQGKDACALREASGGGQGDMRGLGSRVRIEEACPVKVLKPCHEL